MSEHLQRSRTCRSSSQGSSASKAAGGRSKTLRQRSRGSTRRWLGGNCDGVIPPPHKERSAPSRAASQLFGRSTRTTVRPSAAASTPTAWTIDGSTRSPTEWLRWSRFARSSSLPTTFGLPPSFCLASRSRMIAAATTALLTSQLRALLSRISTSVGHGQRDNQNHRQDC